MDQIILYRTIADGHHPYWVVIPTGAVLPPSRFGGEFTRDWQGEAIPARAIELVHIMWLAGYLKTCAAGDYLRAPVPKATRDPLFLELLQLAGVDHGMG
jgi:hypothetical protein